MTEDNFIKIGHREEFKGGAPKCQCGELMMDKSATPKMRRGRICPN